MREAVQHPLPFADAPDGGTVVLLIQEESRFLSFFHIHDVLYAVFFNFDMGIKGLADKAFEPFHAFLQAYLGVTAFINATDPDAVLQQDAAEDIRTPDQPGEAAVSRLVIESALIAGFSKILAEKLIRLCGADTQEVLAAEQVPQP